MISGESIATSPTKTSSVSPASLLKNKYMPDATSPITKAGTIEELNIHLSYIRDQIKTNADNRIVDMAEIKNRLDTITNNQVSRSELIEVQKIQTDHETRVRVIEASAQDNYTVRRLVYGCVAFILTAVVSAIIYLVVKRG